MSAESIPILHAVTNDEVVARADFIDIACGVMRVLGTRGALHLRRQDVDIDVGALQLSQDGFQLGERFGIALCDLGACGLRSFACSWAHEWVSSTRLRAVPLANVVTI